MQTRLTAGLTLFSLGISVKLSECSGIGIYHVCILVYVLFFLLIWLQTVHDALVQENILGLKRNKPNMLVI